MGSQKMVSQIRVSSNQTGLDAKRHVLPLLMELGHGEGEGYNELVDKNFPRIGRNYKFKPNMRCPRDSNDIQLKNDEIKHDRGHTIINDFAGH